MILDGDMAQQNHKNSLGTVSSNANMSSPRQNEYLFEQRKLQIKLDRYK